MSVRGPGYTDFVLFLPPKIIPMGLSRRPEPFDNPEWLFELKWDGFRALFYKNEDGGNGLLSRNGNLLSGFDGLAAAISRELTLNQAVLDGEIVCLDRDGQANFADLFYRRKACHFYAFDVLFATGLQEDKLRRKVQSRSKLARLRKAPK